MYYRPLSLLLGIVVATTAIGTAQIEEYRTGSDSPAADTLTHSTLTGTVTSADGSPLNNIRIEVRRIGIGSPADATYSHVNGSFDFANLRPGSYEVVAIDGVMEAREQFIVQSQLVSLSLRMPVTRSAAPTRGTISVAELKVPDKAKHLLDKAQGALSKGHSDEAEKQVEEALQAAPDYAAALSFRAALKLTRNDTQSALDDLDHAVKADPNFAQAYMLLGAAFNQLGRYDEALRSLDRGSMYDPKSWQVSYEMSKAWMGKHDYVHAIQQLNRTESLGAVRIAGQVHLLKGYAFMGQKQFEQAQTELQAYLTSEPQSKMAGSVRAALAQIQTQMAQSPAALTLPTMTGIFAQAH
ncbi:TPR repeat protein [Candidatus Koribacter versatilis Ellin345]|uniref:TPR repeat protein n=2 Tax=Candidatus Korobacter versatilis TaxID=658062 RepID=Q1IKI4_KORVE|nr:TPR repeat protein [Candidatus Koribacter versatilis Ellin345]